MGTACYALQARKTANLLTRAYNHALNGLDLEISQFSTLCVIALERVDSVAKMAEHLGVDRSTLVRNLKILQRKDLIAPHAKEGRRIIYRLTPEGEATLSRALPLWQAMQEGLGAALPADPQSDPRQALRTLRKAARAIDSNTAT